MSSLQLRSHARKLICDEQQLALQTRRFSDCYSDRMREAFDVMEYIEEMGTDAYGDIQKYGGFELTWSKGSTEPVDIWLYSNVNPWKSYSGEDVRHEHGMSFEDFCENWLTWYGAKSSEREVIQRRIEKERQAAEERAAERVAEQERAEYERLKEKYGDN